MYHGNPWRVPCMVNTYSARANDHTGQNQFFESGKNRKYRTNYNACQLHVACSHNEHATIDCANEMYETIKYRVRRIYTAQ